MKTTTAIAIAAIFAATSFGGTALAQTPPQQPPTPPQQPPMPQQPPSQQPPQQPTQQPMQQDTSNHGMSSQKIVRKIKHELKSHGVTPTQVQVRFQDGTATLSGTVANRQDVSKAKSAAMQVRGVKHVDTSGLHVRGHGHSQGQGNGGQAPGAI